LDSWNMSPKHLEEAIEDCISGSLRSPDSSITFPAKPPKAIIPVHLYGMSANMSEINQIADKYDIPVIEDAAESLGSTYRGQSTGTFSTMGILSFNGNKIITTSGGGALISDNEELINKARFLATQARDDTPHYQHSVIGYNYRMSNILAGIGRGQMEVVNDRVEQRRSINHWYRGYLNKIEGIDFQSEPNSDYYSNFWLTAITIDSDKLGVSREDLRCKLMEEKIESRPLWKPMHLQPVFQESPYYGANISDSLFEKGLCLPSGSNLSGEDKNRIKHTIKSVLGV
jgi:dTDP-4-amino-4,6-dideoxygalactose transaminase